MNIRKKHSTKIIGIIFTMLVLSILFTRCEERYNPVIDTRYKQVLVVDGMISNDAGPYTVKLSYSSSIDHPEQIPISGFTVSILDNTGNIEVLTESQAGNYVSSALGMQGVPERKYKLHLKSPDGINYESNFEKLEEPIEIDSVYAALESVPVDDYPYAMPGYQFYIDVLGATNDSTYFLWQLNETYKYTSDFNLFLTYDGILHTITDTDTLKTCWASQDISEVFMISTASFSEPRITNFPLNYVASDTRRLSYRYSLLTTQYGISKNAYQYWSTVKEQNNDGGNLYSNQPYQIRGNLYNPDNPEEPVYGYFMAAASTTKRIFVNTPEPPAKMHFPVCELTSQNYEDFGWMFLGPPPPANDPGLVTMDANGIFALPHPACIDCRLKGGKLEKPDFWIDY